MSGIWIGSRVSAARPMSPSPFRRGAARRASTNSASSLCVARSSNCSAPRRTRRSSSRPRRRAGWHARRSCRAPSRIQRRADRLADLAERRQLLDRAGQLVRPRLQLLEQADVLDRDHGLVGEGLEERDLVVGEPAGLAAGHRDRPDRLVVTEHRHHDLASIATDTSVGACGFGQSGIGVGVGDIERRSIANGLGVRPARSRSGRGKTRPQGGVASGVGARERGELDLIARDPGQRARVRPQQADGAGHDRVEHRLHIRLRAADDAQDVAGGGLRVQRRRSARGCSPGAP